MTDKQFGYGYSLNSDIDSDINDDDTLGYYRSRTTGFGKGVFFSDGYWNWCGNSSGMASGQGQGRDRAAADRGASLGLPPSRPPVSALCQKKRHGAGGVS